MPLAKISPNCWQPLLSANISALPVRLLHSEVNGKRGDPEANEGVIHARVVGELIPKGDGVMKEYYKNPEKTAETIKNGWLHTGDMVKMDRVGFIKI